MKASCGGRITRASEPAVVTIGDRVDVVLDSIGMPCSGPRSWPALRSASSASASSQRFGIELDDRVELRPGVVDRGDAVEVGLRQCWLLTVPACMRACSCGDAILDKDRPWQASDSARCARLRTDGRGPRAAAMAIDANKSRTPRMVFPGWSQTAPASRGPRPATSCAGKGAMSVAAASDVSGQHPDDEQVDRQHRDRRPAAVVPQRVQVQGQVQRRGDAAEP